MGRSIVAVVVGFVVVAGLSIGTDLLCQRIFPVAFSPGGGSQHTIFLVGALGYVGAYTTLGAWVTAYLAPGRAMGHALALGGIGEFFTLVGTIGGWASAPVWYHAVAVLMVLPLSWLGGALRERQLRAG